MSKPKFIEELESFTGKTVIKVVFDSKWKEFQVKVFKDKAFKVAQTYHALDKEDAIQTAFAMIEAANKEESKDS